MNLMQKEMPGSGGGCASPAVMPDDDNRSRCLPLLELLPLSRWELLLLGIVGDRFADGDDGPDMGEGLGLSR